MKRMMVLAAVAAMALGAKAEMTSYLHCIDFAPAKGDTSPETANLTQKGYYQAYIIQYSGAQSIDDYVKANTMESIAAQTITTFDYGDSLNEYRDSFGQYHIDGRVALNGDSGIIPVPEGFDPANAYAVVYYLGGEETPSEYMAISNDPDYAEDGQMRLDDMERTTGWHEFGGNVPEPTSGLLLLLGMAGLAPKRRLNS